MNTDAKHTSLLSRLKMNMISNGSWGVVCHTSPNLRATGLLKTHLEILVRPHGIRIKQGVVAKAFICIYQRKRVCKYAQCQVTQPNFSNCGRVVWPEMALTRLSFTVPDTCSAVLWLDGRGSMWCCCSVLILILKLQDNHWWGASKAATALWCGTVWCLD